VKTIETERLLIRKWDIERDVDDAFEFYGDEETMRFIPGGVRDREGTRATLQRMIDRESTEGFGICLEGDSSLYNFCTLDRIFQSSYFYRQPKTIQ